MRKCLVAMDSLNLSPQVTTVVLAFLYKAADEICPGCVAHKGKNARMQKANEVSDIIYPRRVSVSYVHGIGASPAMDRRMEERRPDLLVILKRADAPQRQQLHLASAFPILP